MNVLVLSGYGINCENETLHAFEVVGFKGKIVHINDLIQNPKPVSYTHLRAHETGRNRVCRLML